MTYFNFFSQLNFNIGAMIGNSIAGIVGRNFFQSSPMYTNAGFLPFGIFQYPQINFVSPPMSFTSQPIMYNQSVGNTIFESASPAFTPVNTNISSGFDLNGIGMDSFNYSVPVTYTKPEIKPAEKSKTKDKKVKTKNPKIKDFGSTAVKAAKRMVENAKYYVGKVNDDATGNRLFSNGVSQAWCADFVTAITKKSYGTKFPSDFGKAVRGKVHYSSCSVQGIKYWAEDNNCYKELPKSEGEKAEYIASNIKAGDIMIELRNGKSHTGVVTKVYEDGSFDTVEGNCSDSVKSCHYKATSKTLSGFVSMDNYA